MSRKEAMYVQSGNLKANFIRVRVNMLGKKMYRRHSPKKEGECLNSPLKDSMKYEDVMF